MPCPAAVTAPLALLCLASVARADAVLDEVFAADRAFAHRSAEAGAQSAFLEYLAPDAVLFRPMAVNGVEWLRTHEEATGQLDWSPVSGRASCDGDLAVTLGPWVYRQDSATDTGYYLTLWRRDEAGPWRVVLDHGIDVALRRSLAVEGLVLRDEHAPSAPTADWPADASRWHGVLLPVTRGLVAAAGSDFGYSYGELTLRAKHKASAVSAATFVRVWVREGRAWRVLIDMTTAVPTPAAAP